MMPSCMYRKNKSLIVKSHHFVETLTVNVLFRAFVVVFLFIFQDLFPGEVALLRTMVFL